MTSQVRHALGEPSLPKEGGWGQQDLDDGLVHAAYLGNLYLVQWFLSRGAHLEYWQDPSYEECSMEQHTFKSSAILAACQQGHLEAIICMHKVALQSKALGGLEGLSNYWAILIETLKNRNQILGKCSVQDDDGQDIDLDVDPFLQPFCFLENLRLLKYLIDSGADLSVRGQSGKTPLMKAAGSPRYAKALELMLQAGADPNTVSRQHYSALVCAVRKRNITAMRKLLEYGACLEQLSLEVRMTDSGGNDNVLGKVCHALVYSVALGYLPETQLLIQWGARPSMIPRFLLYVVHFLDQSDLTSYTDCISYLHLAFYRCQPELVKYLLEINFLSPQDLCSLGQDKDLFRHLMVEREEEEETERDLASVDVNMNLSGRPARRRGSYASNDTGSTDIRRYPARSSLSLFTDFSQNPPSLFTLCIMSIRKAYGTDSWVQGRRGVDHIESSLGLPKPLMKCILYANTWLSS
ncbi:ankyrin repeat protein [Elysia marginata]|uniref:Ankyrin repeat protein n=1 Tax=Elysia marginata TaxID=1093978 RepID=A0AAV4HR53_9GAST|nr:ankyrin repeat protein [Elysia marginata]